MIKFQTNEETGERTVVVYDYKNNISFCRPVFGIETLMDDQNLIDYVQQKVNRWRKK